MTSQDFIPLQKRAVLQRSRMIAVDIPLFMVFVLWQLSQEILFTGVRGVTRRLEGVIMGLINQWDGVSRRKSWKIPLVPIDKLGNGEGNSTPEVFWTPYILRGRCQEFDVEWDGSAKGE